ncbi:MAG: hypothetical protein BMS9Abin37_1333 [Acidobacteriota bacterium]|nr:MAG: hypothetical protein BMS9Abin37_1333 [Acidobacteriota bacterium]
MLKEETRSEVARLEEQLGRVILGKPDVLDDVMVALFSGSHILMEDVPGVGKTTLAKELSKSIASLFTRVQFTPDLLPTDILGTSIYNPKDGSFAFKKGSTRTFCSRTRSTVLRRERSRVFSKP